MPLTAYYEQKDEVISVLDVENPKSVLQVDSLRCPACGEDLFIRSPSSRITHFCHYPGSGQECDLRGESVRHSVAKVRVARLLREDGEATETWLERNLTKTGRRPDVLAKYQGGQLVAHEVQLSRTSPDELRERTSDFWENGIDVHWWFGPKISESTRDWAMQNLGGYAVLEFGERRHNLDVD